MSSPQTEQPSWERAVRVIKPDQFESNTPQTAGMQRVSAVSKQVANTKGIWAGITDVPAHIGTGKHHHGDQETVIYVVTGSIRMIWGNNLEFQADATAGDFIYVPPFVPHKEMNAGDIPSQWVIARTGQEPIVDPHPLLWNVQTRRLALHKSCMIFDPREFHLCSGGVVSSTIEPGMKISSFAELITPLVNSSAHEGRKSYKSG